MNMTTIRRSIKQARRNGATYRAIAAGLGITSGAVQRIEAGTYPSEPIAKQLGIPVKCPTCHRKKLEGKKGKKGNSGNIPKIGQANWENYYLKQVTK